MSVQQWLFLMLGAQGVLALQRRFGGRRVWIPKHPTSRPCSYCARRPAHLRLLRRDGASVARIAREFGVTRKHVYALLQRRARPSR